MMQIREGWTLGVGALLAAIVVIIGVLMLISVAPVNSETVGLSFVLAGLSRILP
jgi:hypothetical protein